jgi:flagellar biosynthesis protein FlhF
MRIKKYLSSTLQEGKAQILRELGEDAIILSNRIINRANEPEKQMIEIVAAIDDNPQSSSRRNGITPQEKTFLHDFQEQETSTELLKVTGRIYDEIGSIKEMILQLSESVKYRYSSTLGAIFGELFKSLIKKGISETKALNLIGKISSRSNIQTLNQAIDAVKEEMKLTIKLLTPISTQNKRKVFFFIGPTGSGKTLSLIKLALVSKLVLEVPVLIVSADTLKVGGSEQLQLYASIAGLPFRTVYSPEELGNIYNEDKSSSFIFIDTPGINPLDKIAISKVAEFIKLAEYDQVYYIQSVNVSENYFHLSFDAFKILEPSSIILTKLDENSEFGNIIEALDGIDIPLAYFSTGQKIPDDIEPANFERIFEMMFSNLTSEVVNER